MIGDFGESFANVLLGSQTEQGQLFETVQIGGKWPTIDIYAEISSENHQRMFCFFQIKSTERGYTVRDNKLKVQVPKDKLNKLSAFNAPTYLIGVEYNKTSPPLSQAYIKTVRGNYVNPLSSMETNFVVNAENLILLKQEVETFWNNTNAMNNKTNYQTSF